MAARNQSSCTKARPDIHTVKMAMMPLHFIISDPQTSTAWIRLHHGWSSHPTWGETPAFTSHAKGDPRGWRHRVWTGQIDPPCPWSRPDQFHRLSGESAAEPERTSEARSHTGRKVCHGDSMSPAPFSMKDYWLYESGMIFGVPQFRSFTTNTSVVQFVNGAFSCQWTCVSSSPSGARVRTWTFSKCASVTILASKHVWERRIHNDPTQTTRFPMAINGFKGRYATRSKLVLWAPVGARIKNSGRYIYIYIYI